MCLKQRTAAEFHSILCRSKDKVAAELVGTAGDVFFWSEAQYEKRELGVLSSLNYWWSSFEQAVSTSGG